MPPEAGTETRTRPAASAAAPAKPAPSTPFEMIGGAGPVARIVNRFYDLMETDPAYGALRALHAADLAPMRASLTGFLIAWLGGPRDWFEQRPKTCMMSLHAPLRIDAGLADDWIDAMSRAIDDADVDPALAAQMTAAMRRMCANMVNA